MENNLITLPAEVVQIAENVSINDRIEVERKAEAERIEAERVDRLHAERKNSLLDIWQFLNANQKVQHFGKLSDDEFESIINKAMANKLKIEQEEKEEAERKAKEQADAENKAKLDADKKAALAPDKEKIITIINNFQLPELSLKSDQAYIVLDDIKKRFEQFKNWAISQADNL